MGAGGSGEAAATARLGWNKVIRRAVFTSPCMVLGWTGEGKQPRVDVYDFFPSLCLSQIAKNQKVWKMMFFPQDGRCWESMLESPGAHWQLSLPSTPLGLAWARHF